MTREYAVPTSRPRSSRSKTTRALITLAVVGALAMGATACSGAAATGSEAKVPGVLKAGELSICGINNYPPMEFISNKELTGFDIEMMKEVSQRLGLGFKYVEMSFEGILPGLNAKRCDVASSAMYLNEKRQAVADAIPYMATTAQLLVKAGNPLNIRTLDDLSGKRVAIDSSSSNLAVAKELNVQLKAKGKPEMLIQEYPKVPDTFQQIRIDRADGVIEGDNVLGYLALQEPQSFQYVRFQDVADGRLALYVNKGNPLAREIGGTLEKMYEDGTLSKFAKNYGLDTKNLDQVFAASTSK
jgi:polar amino acid transport system substrate-binding protein